MQSLGQNLRDIRNHHGLTEEEVAIETCISINTIRALEADDYTGFDSPVYAKSFLKTYSRYLGVDISEALAKFEQFGASDEEQIFKPNREQLEDTARPDATKSSRSPLILAPVLVLIFGFVCFSLFSLITGGSLPFGPKADNVAAEPKPAAAGISTTEEKKDISEKELPTDLLVPANVSDTEDIPEAERGVFLDEFGSTDTVYLRVSKSDSVQVLP